MRKMMFLALTLMMLSAASVNAQVRIGGTTNPTTGAVLDLNSDDGTGNTTGGLLLPKVDLISLTDPYPFPSHVEGLMVYNLSGGSLNKGVYYNNGAGWSPFISDESANAGPEPPIIFLRQPEFLWLGSDGTLADTLCFELAAVDKSKFRYQWYKRDPATLLSTPLTGEGAKKDSLFINSAHSDSYATGELGITEGKIYQFYCLVISGSQYGISGTGSVVYGLGARLANGGWIKVANANLGAVQEKTLQEQLDYEPKVAQSGEAADKACDPTVYGDWYQWGRKKDGHQDRKKVSTSAYTAFLSTSGGVPIFELDSDGQIPAEHAAFGKLILRNTGASDWRQYPETDGNFIIDPANEWTWDNADLNPCKDSGNNLGEGNWRVPTLIEWTQIQSNNTWIWHDGGATRTAGYQIKPGGANKPSSLFLPATGSYGHSGNAQTAGVGSNARYWSSTVIDTYSYALYIDNKTIAMHSLTRSIGFPVRCVSSE